MGENPPARLVLIVIFAIVFIALTHTESDGAEPPKVVHHRK
jgi:hypothetical protein